MATAIAPNDLIKAFGINVRRQREKLGLNQRELADRIGTYSSHVCAIESGSKSIRLLNVAVWAKALEITPAALLKG